MASEPTDEEIMEAIRGSGYLMEQEVASELEAHGLHVRTNVAFTDPDEDKSREIDVTAFRRIAFDESTRIAANVEVIAECKNTRNPFVFISRPKNIIDKLKAPEEFIFPHDYRKDESVDGNKTTYKSVSAFDHLGFREIYDNSINEWKAVQFCRIDRNGKNWHANHGGLYDALFYPMAKAIQSRKQNIPKYRGNEDWRYIWLFFPIIVTSGDLLLVDSTSPETGLQRMPHVTFYRELKSKSISGNFGITFVRQDRLKAYLRTVVDVMASRAETLVREHIGLFSTTKLDWKR